MQDNNLNEIDFIGYASGLAGYDPDTRDGPQAFFEWYKKNLNEEICPSMIKEQGSHLTAEKLSHIQRSLNELATIVGSSVRRQRPFAVIGGDHSCGIGTWSGVANQLNAPFSLIWVDAHMDAHTMTTSPSKNIHGMPVAHLLGHYEQQLKSLTHLHPAIRPMNLYLIGVRSFEKEEALFLKQQGVRVYFIEEVIERGISTVLREVLEQCKSNTNHYGFSIDVDAFDAHQMPGTGLPVDNGLCVREFLKAISALDLPQGLLGLEIAEYNPHKDVSYKTAFMMYQILSGILKCSLTKERACIK